ncbi:SUMF1/EgtB/PvdO family nonheme iron enzyme [Spirosoma fluviale]|uniref:Formylglycine-generating enzyme, required for sulfatase activity, contains SUMF1/FGE domain n=1 Tax=Spirosoma fluviale TaxID=1597977 RepID=A0A286GLN2_9BACT|nr:SUMF1/EgtB/PvdO family nonheme iron enzyme [Spirosoma fluviale]SOD96453.1 Formylglycine-generating enzyme, required for sulfatase activity, contains SUMF1/FGE domain [Spirosoma fluviale]
MKPHRYLPFLLLLMLLQKAVSHDKTIVTATLPTGTEKRVALVIGNRDYQSMNPLRNPLNDAEDMARALKALQFEVTTLTNTTNHQLLKGLEIFRSKLGPTTVAVVYFSGHGMSYDNTNYLIPVDANITCQEDVGVWGVKLDLILSHTRVCRNGIVFLDACRKIPNLDRCPTPDRSPNAQAGLVTPRNPPGSAVVFSTEQGTAADDNQTGRNGLFTEALLRYLTRPNLTLKQICDRAAADVEAKSNFKQSPALYDKIRGDFVFIQTPAPPPSRPQTPQYLDLPFSEMVYIPGSTFQMGDTRSEGSSDEKPVRSVTVSSFLMGKYEVTQRQWEAVMGNNPSYFKDCPDCPVENVSWDDVQEFLKKLNARTGGNYRLPTEAEWEYAAGGGAGSRTRFGNGRDILDPAEANFDGSVTYKKPYSVAGEYRQKTVPVGSFRANTLGLYNMSGNVWEWCADWYGPYSANSETNPTGPATGTIRVLRGGCWVDYSQITRVANRDLSIPSNRYKDIGFRVVSQAQ